MVLILFDREADAAVAALRDRPSGHRHGLRMVAQDAIEAWRCDLVAHLDNCKIVPRKRDSVRLRRKRRQEGAGDPAGRENPAEPLSRHPARTKCELCDSVSE